MPTSLKPLLVGIISILAPFIGWSQLDEYIPSNSGGEIIEHAYYFLEYNEEHEQASYVIYELKSDRIYRSVSRTDNFRDDPDVSTGSASKKDYKGSGFDRGHLAPAADMSFNDTAMSESFYMSNMSPQHPSFNRGIWKKGEGQVRAWFEKYGDMVIVTGPVLEDKLPIIGTNKVSVPQFYFKVIYHFNESDNTHNGIGMIIPNAKSALELNEYFVSIDEVEKQTGINFFSQLNDTIENSIESSYSITFWSLLKAQD